MVAIVGITGAVAASRLGGGGRQSRDNRVWAQRITHTLEQARARAVATRRYYRVTIVPAVITIDQSSDLLTWTNEAVQTAPSESLVWKTGTLAAAPGAQDATPHTVRFAFDFTVQVDGSATNNNAHIYVREKHPTVSRAGDPYRISVLPSGTVRLYENW